MVKLAKEKGLSAIALTDHDTIDGLTEAIEAGKKYGVQVITGIEFSVNTDTEMHMLGLGFNIDCPHIREVLDKMIIEREKRNYIVIEKLAELGMYITIEDILAEATSPVTGRSQIAKAMMKKGYVSSLKEAFDEYLYFGRPVFVERRSISPEKAIELIHKSGGKAFLAHLNQTGKTDEELYNILSNLKKAGLDGIEGYYTEYTEEMSIRYRKMADDLGLILSGGSDFHGENKAGYELGSGKGNLRIPYELIENLR